MDDAPYTVGDYLIDRLAEVGVGEVFGVPGDYSLGLLDHVIRHHRVRWVGCTNELNAGYAADAYGRLRGASAVFTTFGVGELSAINAIAGCFAEHVPVIQVVGAPRLAAQASGRALHHTLGEGGFHHFLDMHAPITCARAALTPDNAAAEIDRVVQTVRDRRLPGYLLIPADVAEVPVRRSDAPLPKPVDQTDPDVLESFLDSAESLIRAGGGDVAVLAGLLVHRLGAAASLNHMITAGHLPHATTLWAKSLVDESSPHFAGIYVGAASPEATRQAVEDAATLITAGVQVTDLNSGMFTQRIDRRRTIDLQARSATVGAATFAPMELPTVLDALADRLFEIADPISRAHGPIELPVPDPSQASSADLDQDTLWSTVAGSLRAGDIVVADQGTAFYGMAPHRLPADVTFVGQPLWASIGYTLPALLGACTARKGERGVLLIGDGAAQMTAQELSTIVREQVPAVILVVDNDGYTVERAIHGPAEIYNDIAHWDWTKALDFFGADPARATSFLVRTEEHLRDALTFAHDHPDQLILIQAVLPRDDVPYLLDRLTTILGQHVGRTE